MTPLELDRPWLEFEAVFGAEAERVAGWRAACAAGDGAVCLELLGRAALGAAGEVEACLERSPRHAFLWSSRRCGQHAKNLARYTTIWPHPSAMAAAPVVEPSGSNPVQRMLLMHQERIAALERDVGLLHAVRPLSTWRRLDLAAEPAVPAGEDALDEAQAEYDDQLKRYVAAGLDVRIWYRRNGDARTPAYEMRHDPLSGKPVLGWNRDSLEGDVQPFVIAPPGDAAHSGVVAPEIEHQLCGRVFWDTSELVEDGTAPDGIWGHRGWLATRMEAMDRLPPRQDAPPPHPPRRTKRRRA